MYFQSSLNPHAPQYHPSTFTTTVYHSHPPLPSQNHHYLRHPPPQNHHYLYQYQPHHFPPLTFFLLRNVYNPPTYNYVLNNYAIPSPPPAATTDQTPQEETHPEPTIANTSYRRRRGRTRGRRRFRQEWSRVTATVSAVAGNGVGSYNGNGGRESNKEESMELKRDDDFTTVMIRNIPANYTRKLLMKFLDNHCKAMNTVAFSSADNFISAYDFLYLPVDFRTNANKGYAFVNFSDPRAARRFYETRNNQSRDLFRSPKIRQIVRAKIRQIVRARLQHFQWSTFRCESDEYLPVYFSPPREGSPGQKVELTTAGLRV